MDVLTADIQQYWLAPHVHACRTANHVICLDLKRDEYVGFSAAEARSLEQWIVNWPRRRQDEHPVRSALTLKNVERDLPKGRGNELLAELIREGMLEGRSLDMGGSEPFDRDEEKSAAHIDPPSVALIDGYSEDRPDIGSGVVLRFAAAATMAAGMLRCRPIERIVSRVRRRNLNATVPSQRNATTADVEQVREWTMAFRRLRPLFFTAQNACLFDSLAMSEFLARYRFYPNWVFGVATDPFGAHCWLQKGALVINDSPEHVRRFTPIMVV